jgi:hypothetical protein
VRDPLDLAEQLAQVAAGGNAPSAFSNELRSLLAYCDWPPSTSTSNSILRPVFSNRFKLKSMKLLTFRSPLK